MTEEQRLNLVIVLAVMSTSVTIFIATFISVLA